MRFEEEILANHLRAFQKLVHATARDKGWWDATDREEALAVNRDVVNFAVVGQKLALVHSEVSEALEALRHGNPADDKIPAYSGAEAELADVIIRILDLAEHEGWDVAGALVAKAEMNAGRSHKHGGKAF